MLPKRDELGVSEATEEATERARTAAAATEATAQDAAQAAAREKAVLEKKVEDLERDLGTATVDLAMASRQFSQVSNQLQEASEEATRLSKSNAKLSEDLESESSRCFPLPFHSLFDSGCVLTCFCSFRDVHVSHRDDFEVSGAEAGAERRSPQDHRKRWCD
jgi:chemotaxis protein histidine kinase CheA